MAYCTVADLTELGYMWNSTTDIPNITTICDTASQMVDAYCKQTFAQQTEYSEVHRVRVRDGMIKVFPLNMTVSNVESITFANIGTRIISFTCTDPQYIPDVGYVIAATNAPNGSYLATLTYDFGFAAFPADLIKATVLSAAPLLDDYFLSQDSNVSMVKSIKQGELTIQRQDTDVIPEIAKMILDKKYVRVRAG